MFIRIALAVFLIVAGILTLQLDKGLLGQIQAGLSGNEIASAVYSFVKGDFANVLIVIIGILEILAGGFLILGLFMDIGNLSNPIMIIILIFWVIVILLVDLLGPGGLFNGAFKSFATILSFLKTLSLHVLVLGAILLARE